MILTDKQIEGLTHVGWCHISQHTNKDKVIGCVTSYALLQSDYCNAPMYIPTQYINAVIGETDDIQSTNTT